MAVRLSILDLGASPQTSYTSLAGPHDPRSVRVADSLSLVRYALDRPGYAESRTCWMAPISRWNSFRSEVRRLRPAAVSV
jgi:hypothetical protein